jgi:hypothetical protein
MRVVIAHGHIFKNAGSTFDWSLKRSFGAGFLDHRDDKSMRERGADHLLTLLRERNELQAVSSHCLCSPLPGAEDIRFEPVYFLRHPLERILSVYAFEQRQEADTPGARAAKEMNLLRYVAWRMRSDVSHTIRDYQTCNIAGKHEIQRRQQVNFRIFTQALDNLSGIRCVGVVDRYDQSMVVLEHVLKNDFPHLDLACIKQNASSVQRYGQNMEARVHLSLRRLGNLQAEVLANNSFDLALYRYANQRLDEAIAEVPDFEGKLTDFRTRCQRLGSSDDPAQTETTHVPAASGKDTTTA